MGSLSLTGDHRGYLLDTHTFLWALKNPGRLGKKAQLVLEDTNSHLYLSSISAFEVAQKQRLGKLDETYKSVVENYVHYAKQLGAEDLPIALGHSYLAGNMTWEHRDPFDRLLVAQASLESLAIITDDAQIKIHPWIEAIW